MTLEWQLHSCATRNDEHLDMSAPLNGLLWTMFSIRCHRLCRFFACRTELLHHLHRNNRNDCKKKKSHLEFYEIHDFLMCFIPGLPWRDNTIIWTTNQNHLTDFQKVLAEPRWVVRFNFIVNVWQKRAEIFIESLLMWVVPIISDRCVLANIWVK